MTEQLAKILREHASAPIRQTCTRCGLVIYTATLTARPSALCCWPCKLRKEHGLDP